MSYDKLGGVAESEIVAYPITDVNQSHLSNLICAYHSSFGYIVCASDTYKRKDYWVHPANLDKVTPRHFEYVFKAGSKKDLYKLLYNEAMNDIENLEEWRAAAVKEIKQLTDKGCWVEC